MCHLINLTTSIVCVCVSCVYIDMRAWMRADDRKENEHNQDQEWDKGFSSMRGVTFFSFLFFFFKHKNNISQLEGVRLG
jgi:hypothetical protein